MAPEIEPERLFWPAISPGRVPQAGEFVVLPSDSAQISRGLVGVSQPSTSLLVIKAPGRPRTAAAFTGVPVSIALIGPVMPRGLGIGEVCGMNGRDSQKAGDVEFPGVIPDMRDGVGGSEERR